MSLAPDTIAIRHKPFVKRVIKLAKSRGEKTLSKVVQKLAEERMDEIDTTRREQATPLSEPVGEGGGAGVTSGANAA